MSLLYDFHAWSKINSLLKFSRLFRMPTYRLKIQIKRNFDKHFIVDGLLHTVDILRVATFYQLHDSRETETKLDYRYRRHKSIWRFVDSKWFLSFSYTVIFGTHVVQGTGGCLLSHGFYGPRTRISRFSRWLNVGMLKKSFLIKRTGTEFRNGTGNTTQRGQAFKREQYGLCIACLRPGDLVLRVYTRRVK